MQAKNVILSCVKHLTTLVRGIIIDHAMFSFTCLHLLTIILQQSLHFKNQIAILNIVNCSISRG